MATLFLTILCSLFYNIWKYDVEQIIQKEGNWQARITANLDENELDRISDYKCVETVTNYYQKLDTDVEVTDITFFKMGRIYQDMPRIAKMLGLEEDAVSYHSLLLSRYLVHDPQDDSPPLLIPFYLLVVFLVCISLILIIHNSFALSMNARIHQFGIFSSIGATPGQIRTCLMQEAAVLCLIPIVVGCVAGTMFSFGVVQVVNHIASNIEGRHKAVFGWHPLIYVVILLSAVFTVMVSAWIPAWKLSRVSVLEAVRGADEPKVKRKRSSRILSQLFGIEGELAGNSLKAQKKSLRITTWSFMLSFLGFTMMLCFLSLSQISTRETYFEKYQKVWDVMVTLKNTDIEDFNLKSEVEDYEDEEIEGCTVYQKADTFCFLSEKMESKELKSLGGIAKVAHSSVVKKDGFMKIKVPLLILDDASFIEYCNSNQINMKSKLDGVVIVNSIWDSVHSNYRNRNYIPYILEDGKKITLQGKERKSGKTKVKVLGYTDSTPRLREEYEDYALVTVMPLSLWKNTGTELTGAQDDTYISIKSHDGVRLAELNRIENMLKRIVGREYNIETENRIQERNSNDTMITGFRFIIGAVCMLLAMIGIANVFMNTLGFLQQRKRELVRYMSIGLTPAGIRKIFVIQAFVIAGRPVVITLPLTVIFLQFAINASHLKWSEFLKAAPVVPVLLFCFFILVFVWLAFYLGGRKVFRSSLADTLRDDTMM